MISLGLAFMFLLTFAAGEPGVGIGIGGAFALLGAGFYINSIYIRRSEAYRVSPPVHTEQPRYSRPDPPAGPVS
jgi:hypothetical protein